MGKGGSRGETLYVIKNLEHKNLKQNFSHYTEKISKHLISIGKPLRYAANFPCTKKGKITKKN